MAKELKQHNPGGLSLIQEMKTVEEYMMFLNNAPASDQVFINSQANNSKYVPINYIERKLDEMFAGLWSVENFTFQVVVNEIIGQIELKVFHPIAQVWLTRTGVAAVIIQQKSGSSIDDVTTKIKNTLVKDAPHLKSECIKNAAKSLGVVFGRNLNRGQEDKYETLTEQLTNLTAVQQQAINLLPQSNLNETERKSIERKIRTFTDAAISDIIIPYIIKNSTL